MQFLESSILGLRSARHRLVRPEGGSVTLFPMVHIGDPAFYDSVRRDAGSHDFVLYEGVNSQVAGRLTAAYRWIDTARLGLQVQPKDMFTDGRARAVRADLDPAEFDALWRQAALSWRIAAQVVFPAAGLWRRLTATRAGLAREQCQDDLPSREAVMLWNRRSAPFLHAILTARDARLTSVLKRLLAGDGGGATIAVVFGAAHMPAVVRALGPAGFSPAESRWQSVIAL